MMLPGNYRLRLHDTVRVGQIQSTSTLYYPGVRDRQQAELIPVTTGKYLDKLDFQIPADELRHKVSGRFLFRDLAPVVNGTVTFISPAHGYSETVQTGADGSFLLTAVNGTEGDLRAELMVYKSDLESCPSYSIGREGIGFVRLLDAKPAHLIINSDHDKLTLKLPIASCKAKHTPGQ